MSDKNKIDEGNKGPGIKWNPGSVGDYKRGLKDNFKGNVETEKRPGAGQKK
jgi:hypothetical protein